MMSSIVQLYWFIEWRKVLIGYLLTSLLNDRCVYLLNGTFLSETFSFLFSLSFLTHSFPLSLSQQWKSLFDKVCIVVVLQTLSVACALMKGFYLPVFLCEELFAVRTLTCYKFTCALLLPHLVLKLWLMNWPWSSPNSHGIASQLSVTLL